MTHFEAISGASCGRRFESCTLSLVVAMSGICAAAQVPSGANAIIRGEETQQVAQWMGEQRSYGTSGGVLHMAVQLSGPVDARTSERLKEAGIRLVSTLAPGRYLAALDLAGRAARILQAGAPLSLEGVSGIGPVAPGMKLSPDLRKQNPYSWATREVGGKALVEFDLKYADSLNAAAAESLVVNAGGAVVGRAPRFNRIRAQAPAEKMLSLALPHWVVAVHSVDPPPAASTAYNSNQISGQMMNVDLAQANPYSLTGQGVKVMELDEGQIDLHPELSGRVVEIDTAAPARHSTHVAGTIAATGLDPRLKGMAPLAELYSYSFNVDSSANSFLDAISNHGADLANNSWGSYLSEYVTSAECNWIGTYGTSDSDIDKVVNQNNFAIVFAMGNDRSRNLCSLQQQGGFYSAGTPAAAKNTIAVGAVDGNRVISYFSNYGPTADGRLKPDISALGSNVLSLDLNGGIIVGSGTSMATPAITGTLALLIERYRDQHVDSPSPALLKSILLNTAVDLGNPGPDFTYGYGIPDAVEAVRTIDQTRFASGSINAGDTRTFSLDVPGGASALRVMLAYSDVEGTPGSSSALVNDLDLTVSSPGGAVSFPLTLDPLHPAADAVPGKNSRDPVEQVVVQNPAAGTWTVTVTGASVPAGPQAFAISWSFAASAQPPCSRAIAVAPSGLDVPAEGGAQALAITQSSSCAPLRATYPDSWIQGTSEPITGTTAVKLNVDPNTSGAQRVSTLQFSDGTADVLSVQLMQASPCFVGAVAPGTPLSGALTSQDCVGQYGTYERTYTFDGKAGQALTANLDSSDFSQMLILELPDGTQFLESDSIYDPEVRIPQGNRGFVLPVDGQYRVLVTSYFKGETGAYTLNVALPDPATLDALVRLNFITSCPSSLTGTLDSSSPHNGHRGALFPADTYIVYAHLGDTISAQVENAGFDPVLYAMPLATEDILATADNARAGRPAKIVQTILKSGFYSVQITPYLFGQSGSYNLLLGGCRTPLLSDATVAHPKPPRGR